MKLKLMSDKCNLCGEYMIPDKFDYYTCPGCGSQFCPPDDSLKQQKKAILSCARNELVSESIMRLKSQKGGSQGVKTKNLDMKKPTRNALFQKMFQET